MKRIIAILLVAAAATALVTCSANERVSPEGDEPVARLEAEPLHAAEDPHAAGPGAAGAPGSEPVAGGAAAAADTLSDAPKKYIYLTIDDSPLRGSPTVDSMIMSQRVKADIFMVGQHIAESGTFRAYYEKLRQNPYMQIYNHSYSHAGNRYIKYYRDPEGVVRDFERNQADYGITHRIARLPGRNYWKTGERTLHDEQACSTAGELLAERGYRIYGWDIEWQYDYDDYSLKQSVDQLVAEIEHLYNSGQTYVPGHVVLLTHDQMFVKAVNRRSLRSLITKLKELGYTFEHLAAYPQ